MALFVGAAPYDPVLFPRWEALELEDVMFRKMDSTFEMYPAKDVLDNLRDALEWRERHGYKISGVYPRSPIGLGGRLGDIGAFWVPCNKEVWVQTANFTVDLYRTQFLMMGFNW